MTDNDNHPRPPLTRLPVYDAMADAYAALGVLRPDLRERAKGGLEDTDEDGWADTLAAHDERACPECGDQ